MKLYGNYNNYNQYQPRPYYPPAPGFYPPPPTREDIKKSQYRELWKRSTGLGFFVLGYYVTLQILAMGAMILLTIFEKEVSGVGEYLLDIFASAGAVMLPGIIFLAASKYKLSDGFSKTFVKPTLLIPLLLMGMAVAMAANFAANIFDNNISIFGLENHISMSEDHHLNTLEIVLYSVAVSIVPACAEEFGFRGILMGALKKYGSGFAIVASAVIFGAMHGNTTQTIFAFILGLTFGYIDIIADSILPSVILHFLNNFYAILMDTLETNGGFDENVTDMISIYIVLLFCVSGLIGFIYLIKTHGNIFKLSDKDIPENAPGGMLTLRDRYRAFFLNPGIIISLCIFFAEMVFYLIPTDLYT